MIHITVEVLKKVYNNIITDHLYDGMTM